MEEWFGAKGHLATTIRHLKQEVQVLNTHLYHELRLPLCEPAITREQFERLKEATAVGRWIVAGDLNLHIEDFVRFNKGHFLFHPDTAPTYDRINTYLKAWVNKGSREDIRNDYTLVRSSIGRRRPAIETALVREPILSDHYGLFSTVTF